MRRKALSITDISLSKIKQVRRFSIQSDPMTHLPDSTKASNHSKVPESQAEAFKIRKKLNNKKSLSQKNLQELRPTPDSKCPQHLLDSLNSLDKCRIVFERIIKKDQKYGEILSKIKEAYERELSYKPTVKPRAKLNLNLTKVEEKQVKTKPFKAGEPKIPSPLDLENTTARGIPDLGLKNLQRCDFHEEFMSNYEHFSESWRKLINK